MFGFFKKQSKNKDYVQEATSAAVDTNMTIHSIDDEDLVDLRRRLEARVKELSSQIAAKDAEANQLKDVLGETKRQLEFRSAGMDQVQAELRAAYKETEAARHTLHRVKEEIEELKHDNEILKEKLKKEDDSEEESDEDEEESSDEDSSTESRPSRSSLESRVKELEEEIKTLKAERDELLEARNRLESERQEEIKIIQEALEEALADQEAARSCFEKDYEQLRTVNSDREQQMLDDFEWKLRSVEQAAKKKIEEKAKEAEKKVLEARIDVERKVAAHNRDLEKLKAAENEKALLRNMSHEQQRLLREAQREIEAVQFKERVLKDEIAKLNTQIEREKNILAAVQTLNQKKLDEREQIFECRLERQRKEVTMEVEQKVRNELQIQHRDAMQEALRLCREQHEIEKTDANKQAQNRIDALQRQISVLRDLMSQKELQFQKDLELAQVNADRDSLELRRKLDKLDMTYQDRMDALIEKHSSELEEAERRVSQAEMQAGSSRATLELVKEQMARDAEERISQMHQQHQQQLARQQAELEELHEEQLIAIQQKHEAEIAALCKTRINGDVDLDTVKFNETVNKLRKQELMISDLTSTIREQDHALTTITQEKRALQLQLSRIGNAREHNSPPRGLERISECTEPSRESRESSVCREDNVFSSCSSEIYSERSDSQMERRDSQIGQFLDSQMGQYDGQMGQLGSQMGRSDPRDSQIGPDIEIAHCSKNITQIETEQSMIEEAGPSTSNQFDDQIEPIIEEPDSPDSNNDENISPELSIIDDECDNNSDNFEDFEETSQNFIVTLPDNEKSNLLNVPFDSERSTYLSISPARSDATNCLSIPSTPSPERSISFSKTSSEECNSRELQIPRTYYLSHSPDSIFPKEKVFLSRSKSLGQPLTKMHLFSRAASL